MSPAKPETVKRAKKMPAGSRFVMGPAGRLRMRLFAARARAARSRLVAGDARLVHVVDLLGIEELAGVAQVHLVSHEDVEEIGVDVAVLLHAPEDRERIGEGLARLVGAVAGGE